jgi:hypothetical protein
MRLAEKLDWKGLLSILILPKLRKQTFKETK